MMPQFGQLSKKVRAVTSNAGHVPPWRGHVWPAGTEEEREVLRKFGEAYSAYMREVPAFVLKRSALLRRRPDAPRTA
jgi:hypothetical protein